MFSAVGDILDPQDSTGSSNLGSGLGSEIDFSLGYKIHDDALIKFGYSQMLGTSTLEALRGGSIDESSNWAWIMLVIKPTLFASK
jgi:hypothetical protein